MAQTWSNQKAIAAARRRLGCPIEARRLTPDLMRQIADRVEAIRIAAVESKETAPHG